MEVQYFLLLYVETRVYISTMLKQQNSFSKNGSAFHIDRLGVSAEGGTDEIAVLSESSRSLKVKGETQAGNSFNSRLVDLALCIFHYRTEVPQIAYWQ